MTTKQTAAALAFTASRREAGLKAWETIRHNRRRAAALKAWETIRANAAARSDAAFRAWDTRDAAEAA
jgi:hypothetical protein